MAFSSEKYGPAVGLLLKIAATYPLVPRLPIEAMRAKLAAFDSTTMFGDARVVDTEMADSCLAGLWLRFDFLDESHKISQGIETTTGSFWHGIMHRRDADYGNAKYWFARVGDHPVYGELAAKTPHIPGASEQGLTSAAWNAAKFVDLCQRASRTGGALEELCRQVQIAEWQLLFDFCYRRALGLQ